MIGAASGGWAFGALRNAVLLAPVLALAACGPEGEPEAAEEPEAVRVGVRTLETEEITLERSWAGRAEPLRTVAVQAPREGRVTGLEVRDGDRVSEGQILLRMVGTDVEARREVAALRRDDLATELERWERLAAQGAAGPGEVIDARLRLLAAQEALAELDALSENYLVRAPASGRAYGVSAGIGAQVASGQTLLGVEDDGTWGVRLSVPAWEAGLFQEPAHVWILDERGQSFAVDRIASASEAQPGFVRVDLYLEGARAHRGGVEVVHRASEELLLVPWTAVAGEGDRHWVARIAPGDPARVERRTVELGRSHPRGVEILSGLEEGDRVVLFEPRSHPDGRPVIPVEAEP